MAWYVFNLIMFFFTRPKQHKTMKYHDNKIRNIFLPGTKKYSQAVEEIRKTEEEIGKINFYRSDFKKELYKRMLFKFELK